MVKFKKSILLFPFLCIVGVLVNSCETNEGEPVYVGHEYFGHTEGKWLIYQVDSTVYDDFLEEVFHYHYQVKEVNVRYREDLAQENKMLHERFYRENDEQPWQVKNVWTSQLTSTMALKTIENTTYVKLSFPLWINPDVPERGKQWDGNAFNTLPSQNYEITHLHDPMQIGTLSFDSTLRVLQKDLSTLIGQEFQYEIYSPNIGMVMKKYVDLSTDIDGTIIRGVDYTYELIEYGFDNSNKADEFD